MTGLKFRSDAVHNVNLSLVKEFLKCKICQLTKCHHLPIWLQNNMKPKMWQPKYFWHKIFVEHAAKEFVSNYLVI